MSCARRSCTSRTVRCDEMARARIDHAHAHFATAAARLANLAWRMGGPGYSVTAHAKDIYHEEVRVEHLRDKLEPARVVAGEPGLVLTVARLVEKKGLHDLVEACALLQRRPTAAALQLEVVGDGPLRAELRAAAGGP